MKRLLSSLSLSLSLLILVSMLIPSKVHAVDISVGATTWYAWMVRDYSEGDGTFKAKLDPAFFYGPVLSVKLNDDFNFTFIYLYGKFDATMSAPGVDLKLIFKRQDADLALNYKLNNYFKIFAGIKYIGHSMLWVRDEETIEHNGYGPGLGISLTFPITDNVFILGNIGGIYLWGNGKSTGHGKLANYNESGVNSTLSLAYYIASASTTVSLGGRFQYFKSDYDYSSGTMWYKNKIYGATLMATYSFSI